MRWWSIPILVALAWFAFTLTPLLALNDLARAVRDRDTAYIEDHVNFRVLRLSLAHQIAAAIRSGGDKLEPQDRQRAADAAMAIALTVAESLVTPRTVIDLLDDGWPQNLDFADTPAEGVKGEGLQVPNLGRLIDFYVATEMRGFRTVVVALPPNRSTKNQFRIRMRLRDWSWRIVDIELTEALRARIGARFSKLSRPRNGAPNPAGAGNAPP